MKKLRKNINNRMANAFSVFCKVPSVNVRNYEKFVEKRKTSDGIKNIWSLAFQKAIEENQRIYIPKGLYFLDQSLVLPSNREIVAHRKAEICLLKGTKTLLLRNENVIDGSNRLMGENEAKDVNIRIEGGIWAEENIKRSNPGETGAFDEKNSMVGVCACLLFNGVKNLSLRNLRFRNAASFAIQIGRCENFLVENIRFENCFSDGVHINGNVKNGVIRNISGQTGDDLVALNAYDWKPYTISNGPMENILVEKIRALKKKGYNAFRILSAILPTEYGEIDCSIKNLQVCDVKGLSALKAYLQTEAYRGNPEGVKVGRLENLTLEKISLTLNESVDSMENYRKGEPITGHFGAIEIGSNVTELYLKDIRAKINFKNCPTAHLITVGPKSCYNAETGVEIFDPYVKCKVDTLFFKNLVINGKKMKEIKPMIHETVFENLYSGVYDDGYGKIDRIVKI